MPLLTSESIEALGRALCGTYTLPVGDAATVICADLPGRALAAAVSVAGVLYVVLDLDKPSTHRHARAMLREWAALYLRGLEPGGVVPFAEPPRQLARAPLRLVV